MYLTAPEFEAQMPDGRQLLSDEPEMESSLHYAQLLLLVTILEHFWGDREDFFLGANLTVYFSRQQLKQRDFRGPDFFVVRDTERRERNSWVVWEEDGRYPDLIVELLSTSTAAIDRGLKKALYQNRFRTPEYFWFSPDTLEFQGFRLQGEEYAEIPPNGAGWRWSEVLGLYLGVTGDRLRYFTAAGELLPTPSEAAAQERQRAEQERQRAEQERQRAEHAEERIEALVARLRELGYEA